nr:atherin-like [Aegilops tauschii subsp. strangulata]
MGRPPARGATALTRVRPVPGQQDDRAACSPGPHPPTRVAPLTLRSAASRRAPSSACWLHRRTFGSATCSWPRALGGWAGSASRNCPVPAPSCLDHADRLPAPPPRPRRDAARAGPAPSATQPASSTTPRPHRRGCVPLAALQFQPAPQPLLLTRARSRPRGARLRPRWLARGRGPAPPRLPPAGVRLRARWPAPPLPRRLAAASRLPARRAGWPPCLQAGSAPPATCRAHLGQLPAVVRFPCAWPRPHRAPPAGSASPDRLP